MSLIQRAVEQNKAQPVARLQPGADATAGDGPRVISSLEARGGNAGDAAQRRRFEPNYRELAKTGLLTPAAMKTPLALETGMIKRRLLRRMGFLASGQGKAAGSRKNALLVTSANPGEGKTFTALNLALSIAFDEQISVILIDCDTVRPRVASALGLDVTRGLSDVLAGDELHLMDVAVEVADTSLTVIPEGERRLPIAEIFSNSRLCSELDRISERYSDHLVIVDTPPLLATSEASVLADHVDEVVMVVHGTRTMKKTIHAALEMLDCDDRVSLIMNHCPDVERQHGYRYAYYDPYTRSA